MNTTDLTRRLSAILTADVEGFSRRFSMLNANILSHDLFRLGKTIKREG